MTHRRTIELIRRAQAGDERATELLLEANEGLVIKEANKWYVPLIEYADFMQAGRLGLLEAIRRFDVTRKLRFSTYAVCWIRQKTNRLYRGQARLIRVPEEVLGTSQSIPDALLVLDEPHAADAKEALLQRIADVKQEPVEELVANKIERDEESLRLYELIGELSRVQRRTMYLTLGLIGGRPLNQVETAAVLGVTKEAVRTNLKRARNALSEGSQTRKLPLVFSN